jgi:hypothetical protein
MSWHDHVSIDAQPFPVMTEIKAFGHDLASGFRDENGQPINDGKRDVEESAVRMKAISFHAENLTGNRRR